MTKLGLKSGLANLPHGVAHIRISQCACGGDIDEFYGVFFHGDFVDGKFNAHHMAQLAFDELRRAQGDQV